VSEDSASRWHESEYIGLIVLLFGLLLGMMYFYAEECQRCAHDRQRTAKAEKNFHDNFLKSFLVQYGWQIKLKVTGLKTSEKHTDTRQDSPLLDKGRDLNPAQKSALAKIIISLLTEYHTFLNNRSDTDPVQISNEFRDGLQKATLITASAQDLAKRIVNAPGFADFLSMAAP